MSSKSIHNPAYIGPGIWYILHIIALDSDITSDYEFFIKLLRKVVANIGCSSCKKHATGYIQRNNPNKINKQYPPSYYLNKFHNTVNVRLGKPIYTLKESLNHFGEICKECEFKNEQIVTMVNFE